MPSFVDSDEHDSDAGEGDEATQALDFRKGSSNFGGPQDSVGGEDGLGRNRSGKMGRGGRVGGRGTRAARKRRPEAEEDDISEMFEARDKRRKKGGSIWY